MYTDGYVVYPLPGTTNVNGQIKSTRNVKRPASDMLLTDADDSEPNNWPDVKANHGANGMNVAFCDGHVEFVRTGKPILEAYMNGHYTPSVPSYIQDQWLKFDGGSTPRKWSWIK
jgi:prepilin-type processing-associated H-X9-DG protein